MPEERKLVSILFADTVGSTALGSEHDPELVRTTMARYFERMRTIAERHGGTVEKYIGDAVMVVFGVPRVHDDDAERAVRAGLAMRDELAELNRELAIELAARVGINSGQAVAEAGAASQFLVTGDVVNVAARLQQGADIGEVVVGALTEQLTRVAIELLADAPSRACCGSGGSTRLAGPPRATTGETPNARFSKKSEPMGSLELPTGGCEVASSTLNGDFRTLKHDRRSAGDTGSSWMLDRPPDASQAGRCV